MGRLSVLLEWHESDPVDNLERRRNNVIAEAQVNRNPFVEQPDYGSYLYGDGFKTEDADNHRLSSMEETFQNLLRSIQ